MVQRSFVRVVAALLVFSGSTAAQATAVRSLKPAPVLERPRGDSALVATVPLGAVLTVVEQRIDWYLVDVPDGAATRRGWISSQLVEVVGAASGGPSPSSQPTTGAQAPPAAGAQTTPGGGTQTAPAGSRWFVVVNGAYQFSNNDFADGATKRENAEDGRLDITYDVEGGPAFDVAGGGVLWRWIGVGVGVTWFSVSTPGTLEATIPHPFFFNRARSVRGDVADLKRDELAVHVQARGVFPVGERFQIMVFGGPSFFQIEQTIVTDYTYTESYPYDDATFGAATTTRASGTAVGYNAGGDVAFFFTRQLGVGATAQFSGATGELPGALGGTRDMKAGGGQVGAGLRLRF